MKKSRSTDETLLWKLVEIEEKIAMLSTVLEGESLQKGEEIARLLEEIETIAVRSRHRVVEMGMEWVQVGQAAEEEGVVTEKEIRELLEAFA